MSALHTTTIHNCTADELVAVSVLVSRFNSSPCPFEEDIDEDLMLPVQPLTLEQMIKMRDLVIPEGIIFSINDELVAPGTLLSDAMDQAEDNYREYDEKETCSGCIYEIKAAIATVDLVAASLKCSRI